MLDSELFGHVRGAFTGAVQDKPGLLELAHRGELFLDEIGDMDAAIQSKVLKVLEEKTYRRLGDVKQHRVDVKLIAPTHRDLAAMQHSGDFRADLYYRVLERAVLAVRGGELAPSRFQFDTAPVPASARPATLEEVEAEQIRLALSRENGQVAAAADRLGISRSTFYTKLKAHQIDPADYRP